MITFHTFPYDPWILYDSKPFYTIYIQQSFHRTYPHVFTVKNETPSDDNTDTQLNGMDSFSYVTRNL